MYFAQFSKFTFLDEILEFPQTILSKCLFPFQDEKKIIVFSEADFTMVLLAAMRESLAISGSSCRDYWPVEFDFICPR